MKYSVLIISIVLFLTSIPSNGQGLLEVEWQEIVCADPSISHVHSIENDKKGYTYTLGSFAENAQVFNETINDSLGAFFLTKQDSLGEKVFVKNFGGGDFFSFGDIEICDNGDMVLAVNFKSTFYLNGDSLTSSPYWNAMLLKVDEYFNLKWFKKFPSTAGVYCSQIIVDSDNHIYASIPFTDTISVNGMEYTQDNGYGTIVAKLDSNGATNWFHHYYSDYHLHSSVMKLKDNCQSCSDTLYFAGDIGGELVLVDGVLKDQEESKFNGQLFVSTIDEEGEVLSTKILDDGIRSIANFQFYQNKTYFAGRFIDTINWNNTYSIPDGYSSVYIGELNDQLEISGFKDLESSDQVHLTNFDISAEYGFMIVGTFYDAMSIGSASIQLDWEYDRGSFIATINDELLLNDCKFIEGGDFYLKNISLLDTTISGAAVFNRTCNFLNETISTYDDDISTFQTSSIKKLDSFNPQPFPEPKNPSPSPIPSQPEITCSLSANIFPNPFRTSFELEFNKPISSINITMTNSVGQQVKDISYLQIDTNTVIVSTFFLQSGAYILNYSTDGNCQGQKKLIKINEY